MSTHTQIAIIGSGPAGFTAGIYTSRANHNTLIFEGMQPGGQLMITTEIENFPGFETGVQGPEMMNILRKQANRFGAESVYKTITKVDLTSTPKKLWAGEDEYTADAVIIATGASARRLTETPGEKKYWGKGISACATCDGFFYKGAKIFVIGGGDTAMEEAVYLTHFAESVTILHRREFFRASEIMFNRAKDHPKISIMTNVLIDEYLGESKMGIDSLTGVRLKNTQTGELTEVEAGGVFYGIGHTPNTKVFGDILEYDANGYIITKVKTAETNIEGVFACGDVQDPSYRQAITAAGSGCMAAIDADRFL